MPFSGLDHVGFTVSSLDRAVDFYSRLLEREPLLRRAWDVEYVGRVVGYEGATLDAAFWQLPGGAVLELIEYLEPQSGCVDLETYNVGNAHLCLVTDDIERDFERLGDIATFRHPTPVAIPWGPYRGGFAAYLRDPDDISIELIQLPLGGPTFGAGS